MYRVLVLATLDDPSGSPILKRLEEEAIEYVVATDMDALSGDQVAAGQDALLIDLSVHDNEALVGAHQWCERLRIPLLCGLPAEYLAENGTDGVISDFFLIPPARGEITARIKHAHLRNRKPEGEKVLQAGDLRIDMDRYEVFNRGRRVLLTFKEYQLLYVLAANIGRVCSRESLLHQIWEYDYFGGTRTVDVHIRRLRSKIEDAGQTYIETVWNVGYRFRPQDISTASGELRL